MTTQFVPSDLVKIEGGIELASRDRDGTVRTKTITVDRVVGWSGDGRILVRNSHVPVDPHRLTRIER